MRIINLHHANKCRPSEIMDIDDPYTAFCFDEAINYIVMQIKEGNEPCFKKRYSSPSQMYKELGL